MRGQDLFLALGCAGCHVPELATSDHPALRQLAYRTARAYSDLLLHDMGKGLADERTAVEATSREWRTAPLWGLGRTMQTGAPAALLHDGRVADAAGAILWHGGEGQASREGFRQLSKQDRDALLDFLGSL